MERERAGNLRFPRRELFRRWQELEKTANNDSEQRTTTGKYGPGSAGGTETSSPLVTTWPICSTSSLRMSLKVPKANNIQLFKDGYKVRRGVVFQSMQIFLMIFVSANVRPRGCSPSKYRGRLGIIEPSQDEFWAKRYAIPLFLLRWKGRRGSGRNKLVINHLGRLFVTSDAATIIREIEVVHPAAKLLVMASQAQETEVSPAFVCRAIGVEPLTSDGGCNKHSADPRWRAVEEGRISVGYGSSPK